MVSPPRVKSVTTVTPPLAKVEDTSASEGEEG